MQLIESTVSEMIYYVWSEWVYLFAMMAICQKGTMTINAGDQTKQQQNTKVQMQPWNVKLSTLTDTRGNLYRRK